MCTRRGFCVEEPSNLDLLPRILESLMERGSVVLVEPISGIEWQQFDHRSFGQIGRLVDDKASGLHASLQRHMITVASRSVAQQARPAYVGESGVHHRP